MNLLTGVQRSLRRALVRRGAKSITINVLGRPIHYYEVVGTGKGLPVVLVHGLGGSANGFYKILFPLAERFSRVFALDLPGHGFSPRAEPATKLRENLDLVAAFCEQVVGAPVFAIGNSLGGGLCLLLASERPELIGSLALLAPAGARLEKQQRVEIAAALLVRNGAQARALTRRLFHRAPLVTLIFATLFPKLYGSPTVREILAGPDAEAFLSPEQLRRVSVPTLLLWGKSEKLLPFEAVEYFRAHLPRQAGIEIVEGFGHVPQIERPKELVRRLSVFADQARLEA
ncbi:MAG TPA: alpha/beta fold hydrolase [Myxococcaceae bacterium]|nr:alpha/beta fold hydrolase [Myxococcaceae bacterium]